jgi:hypothetical protein
LFLRFGVRLSVFAFVLLTGSSVNTLVAGAAPTTTTTPVQSHAGSPILGNLIGGTIVLVLLVILWRQVGNRRRSGMSGIFSFGHPLPQPKEPVPPTISEPFRDDHL